MKPQYFKKLALPLLTLTLAFVLASPAFAQNGRGLINRPATTPGVTRSCEARLDAIKTRMTQLVKLSENMFRAFDAISTRVQTFYTEKVLPTGKTVSNYQALLDDITAKKTAVSSAISSAQADIAAFSCVGDVRGLYNEFRLDMQAVKAALKDYRTSIRNLIVAVHSIAPDDEGTPTATVTP